jgi:retron-type reverse transcriptase
MNEINEWKIYLHNRGIDSQVQKYYLHYITPLIKNSLPVIFEIEHLSHLLGIKKNILEKMVYGTENFYREFLIKKNNTKKKRIISVPYPSLLSIQKWIKDNILNTIEIHKSAHGYVTGHSVISYASPHLNKKAFLKIDLKDFFPTIKINRIITLFVSLGYSFNISLILAKLCTLNDELPQGAPTSPSLSNIVSKLMDKRLTALSFSNNLQYTRYSDDIAFSGDYISNQFKEKVFEVIVSCGFIVNKEKSFLSYKKSKRVLVGLNILENNLRLPRKFKKQLKQEVYYIEKFGLFSHMSNKKIKDVNYVESLYGRLQYWKYIEVENIEVEKLIKIIYPLLPKN